MENMSDEWTSMEVDGGDPPFGTEVLLLCVTKDGRRVVEIAEMEKGTHDLLRYIDGGPVSLRSRYSNFTHWAHLPQLP